MKTLRYTRCVLVFFLACICVAPFSLSQDHNRDVWQQPEAIMDSIGVREGMAIGEAGAGRGYFTFHLAQRVGPQGRVLANDIDAGALEALEEQMTRDSVSNITTIVGAVDDPRFPEDSLDMIVIMNAFHEFTQPVRWMENALPDLKPGATLVIIDRDPDKIRSGWSHFKTKDQILEAMEDTGFTLVRFLSFLPRDNIFIFRAAS